MNSNKKNENIQDSLKREKDMGKLCNPMIISKTKENVKGGILHIEANTNRREATRR